MLQTFKTILSLLLHECNFAIVRDHNVKYLIVRISDILPQICLNVQVENYCIKSNRNEGGEKYSVTNFIVQTYSNEFSQVFFFPDCFIITKVLLELLLLFFFFFHSSVY